MTTLFSLRAWRPFDKHRVGSEPSRRTPREFLRNLLGESAGPYNSGRETVNPKIPSLKDLDAAWGLDTYRVNVSHNDFKKVYRAKHVLSKVEGTPSTQRKECCHFDQREKSFLDSSHSLGMTGLGPSPSRLCAFARVIVLRFP